MKLSGFDGKQATIQVTPHELVILNNALNEVCNALDIEEFSTRMGAEEPQAEKLMEQVGAALEQIEKQAVGQH
jgi:hypothetical protein